MSQVSRRFLPQEIETHMYDIFWNSLMLCKDKETIALFLDDLLTPTEKVMLAKRVSIAFLLLKGYNYRHIGNIIKVSNPTIWTVKSWLDLKGKGYRKILTKILNDEQWKVFWGELDTKLQSFFFPTPGKGVNWKQHKVIPRKKPLL